MATVASMGIAAAAGDPERVVRQLAELAADGYRIVVAADGEGSAARLRSLLSSHGISPTIDVTPLERGCILPAIKLAVIAEHDVTGRRRAHRAARRPRRDAQGFFDDLKAGDYVVHHQHGVARYGGMVKRAIGGVERDYLLLEYKGDDKLYVPSDQIDAVRHYTGGESPTLSRLGGDGWQKAKAKVRSAVSEIAQELVVLYQKRIHEPGHAFPEDTPWQRELEDAFPYQETPDQLVAIAEVKGDMQEGHPDGPPGVRRRRLRQDRGRHPGGVQGGAGRQAGGRAGAHDAAGPAAPPDLLRPLRRLPRAGRGAVPLPHHRRRRGRWPRGCKAGEVDVVIGTHRLLSDDIELQGPRPAGGRRGAALRREPQGADQAAEDRCRRAHAHRHADPAHAGDVASPASATSRCSTRRRPTGCRSSPTSASTTTGRWGRPSAASCCARARCSTCTTGCRTSRRSANHVRDLVPEARVAVAHGQMDEGTLEQVVLAFSDGDYDVLVCTTIIESGIDMPTVNTLVCDRADLLGLGQLHQLRGRVGRSGQRAYAYLFVPQDRVLSEEAYERLKTIGEATELGSGFKIAMRDLEIRGAGNLLGTGQSGHIAAVGYDLYCQMVSRGGGRAEGRAGQGARRDQARPAAARPTSRGSTSRRRSSASRPTGAWPPSPPTTRCSTSAPSGRTATARCPPPAEALLAVARLRAEASRTGVREVVVVKPTASAARRPPPACRRCRSRPASRSASSACTPPRSTRKPSSSSS